MVNRQRRSYEARVLTLQEDALLQHRLGHVAVAVANYREACDLVREAIDADPNSRADVQQLASMLYTLGEWELTMGEFDAAVDSLTQAESGYADLGRLGGGPGGGNPDQLVADVVIRRARVHTAAGHDLSALVDAQEAVLTCLGLAAGPPRSAARLDAARVVALAAQIQLLIGGDPDLVVGAADWAIREFISGLRAGDALEVRPGDLTAFRIATSVAHRVHSAFGRPQLADVAHWFATATGADGTELGLPEIDEIRTRPTLATLLADPGHDRYRATLTAPTDGTLLVPAMRVDGRIRGAYGELLAGLRNESGDALFALESHALFAAASSGGDVNMRYQFGHYGRVWGDLLLSVGRQAQSVGLPLVTDAANWLVGVLGQLAVHAVADAAARATAIDALRWLRERHEERGDTAAAERSAAVLADLESLDPLPENDSQIQDGRI